MDFLVPLWQHQKEALQRSSGKDEFAFFFEVGTGKSATTCNALRLKYLKHDRILRTLVLCPPIVIENWKREFKMHTRVWDKVVCLVGTGKQRLKLIREHSKNPTIFVTNFESLLMKDVFQALMDYAPECLVIDEVHKLKNLSSQRTKLSIKLADQSKYRFILTGTPILNTPLDIFAQFRVLDKGETFGTNFYLFRAKYFTDKNAHMPRDRYFPNWVIKPGALEEISRLMQAKSMSVKKELCLDLPPLVRQTIYVEMSPEQARLYKEMRDDLVTYINDKACVAQLAITKMLRLMQIASGFVSIEGEGDGAKNQIVPIKDNPKAIALKELLEEISPNHKCILWASFTQDYATLRAVCDDLSIDYVEVHGEISQANKVKNVDRFNEDKSCRVCIAHPASSGTGINMVSASYSVFFSRTFSLEHDIQATARNYRHGSQIHTKVTKIDLVLKGTIDELVVEALANKENVAEKMLEFARCL